jgi:hypothetical protein
VLTPWADAAEHTHTVFYRKEFLEIRHLPRAKSFFRAGHGAGKGVPHIEIVRDELSAPVPAPPTAPDVPLAFREDGKIADADTAKEMGRRGGLAKARRVRLVDSLGLAKIAEDSAFGPYRSSAEQFIAAHLAELAQVAGGVVGTGPSTMVTSAALQLAASRYCFDRASERGDTDLMKQGSVLANDSRQNLIAAYELATRTAAEHAKNKGPADPLAAWRKPKEAQQ